MATRITPTLSARLVALAALTFCLLAGFGVNATAAAHHRHRRRRHPTPTPTPTPKPTPTVAPMVLIAGGSGMVSAPTGESPAVLDSAEIYDPSKGQFFPIYPMTTRRDRHTATVLRDGKVLIVGGVDTVMTPLAAFPGPVMPWILRSTEIFDPSTGRFAPAASMAIGRDEPTATTLNNGDVLVVGGGDDSTELYHPPGNKFSNTGSLVLGGRYEQTATLLSNGKVLIAGGGEHEAEFYDSATGKFSVTGKLSRNRIYDTATLLQDGRVLVAGGSQYSRSSAMDSTEIYDPHTGLFRAGAKMKEPRAGHTATLLKDGRVLLAGGNANASAELYDPKKDRFVALLKMNVEPLWAYRDTIARRPRAHSGRLGSELSPDRERGAIRSVDLEIHQHRGDDRGSGRADRRSGVGAFAVDVDTADADANPESDTDAERDANRDGFRKRDCFCEFDHFADSGVFRRLRSLRRV